MTGDHDDGQLDFNAYLNSPEGIGFEAGNETSYEAAASWGKEETSRLRRLVLRTVREAGEEGRTCDEMELELGLTHQTCSARCTELKQKGFIFERRKDDVLVKRRTRGGRMAAVLFYSP
jgi:hypothetical protein